MFYSFVPLQNFWGGPRITVNGVTKLLHSVKPFKATGTDGIPPFILKELSNELAPVFTLFSQASLTQRTLPTDWKRAFITPVFKKRKLPKTQQLPSSLFNFCN